jgi:hypothetical protein
MTGNVLAGMLSGRVVAGHPVAVQYERKVATLTALYQGQLTEQEIKNFLRANRASYVLEGPEERALGSMDPGEQLHLPVVMRVGDAVAYAIPGGAGS